MAYTITIPADWLYSGARVFIIEDEDTTGNPPHVYPNTVLSFTLHGFYHRYSYDTPVYFKPFDEIGGTVFETKQQAEAALKRYMRNRKEKKE